MNKKLILLAVLIALYLIPSLLFQAVYGDSYGFWAGENCWKPDGQGGWVKYGNPTDPQPAGPSVNVPLLFLYLPILLPGLVLAAFMFTPLSRKLEDPPVSKDDPEVEIGQEPESDS